jgi:hypothetical protein
METNELKNKIHSGVKNEFMDFFGVSKLDDVRMASIFLASVFWFIWAMTIFTLFDGIKDEGDLFNKVCLGLSLGGLISFLIINKRFSKVRRMMKYFKGVSDIRTLKLFLIRNPQFWTRTFFAHKLVQISKEDFESPHSPFPKPAIPLLSSICDALREEGLLFYFDYGFLEVIFTDRVILDMRYGRFRTYPQIQIMVSMKEPLDPEEEFKVRSFAENLQLDAVYQNQNVPLFARMNNFVDPSNSKGALFQFQDKSRGDIGIYVPKVEIVFEGIRLAKDFSGE